MRRAKQNKSKSRIALSIILLCLALFVIISLVSYHFLNRQAIGVIGKTLSCWLAYWFGYCAYALPILLALFGLERLGVQWVKKQFGYIVLWLAGISLFAGALSYAIGFASPLQNYAGLIGSGLARFLFDWLGFLLTFFISLFVLFGLLPYLKRSDERRQLSISLFVFVLVFLTQLTIAFIWTNGYWHVRHLFFAGRIAQAIVKGFNYLIGWWGSLVLLVCIWLVILILYTRFFDWLRPISDFFIRIFKFIGKGIWLFLKWIGSLFAPLFGKKIKIRREREYSAPVIKTETPTLFNQTEPTPAFPEPAQEKKPIQTDKTQTAPASKHIAFDEQEFQNEFLASLDTPPQEKMVMDEKDLQQEANLLIEKLKEFGIDCKVTEVLTGPMITRFELEPAPGIKIQRIENLADDLSLSLKAERIRILAPIPGKAVVGIEVPNKFRRIVYLRDILTTDEYTSKTSPLTFALGETITGEPYAADLREMPHVLIAGTTGSGKSVCINTMITSMIFRSSHNDVRFLTIDPKQLELPVYNSIPHLLNITTIDPKHAIKELDRIIGIMEARYGIFANLGVRDIAGYNQLAPKEGLEKKPYIVVVIDELADLMIRAPTEIEEKITRLAQMSRAVGIHLVLATQRPSVDVITGLIKANFPCRIAFQVASKTDSRTILDMNGAEALLGRGDMLFLPPGKGEPIRLHCAFVSAQATRKIVDLWTRRYLTERLDGMIINPKQTAQELVSKQVADVLIDREKASLKRKQEAFYSILSEDVAEKLWQDEYHKPLSEEQDMPKISKTETTGAERETDELFEQAARIVFRHREASVSMLQRRLDIGWARAGRIIDQLEQLGIVGPYVGSKSRKVMVQSEEELEKTLALLRGTPQPPKS
jgi:S-DNA-T family DNA segregation ATPase FtsK/SpoIIIE